MPSPADAPVIAELLELARTPTHVDLGYDTLMAPDHPRLAHYADDVHGAAATRRARRDAAR